jgi:predicted alpha/beta-fold hydrolase
MTILIETERLPERGPLNLKLNVTATINTTAEEARRKVSVFAGSQIADLISGEKPDLVWQKNGAYWRVPVVLSSRSLGRIGQVGFIDVNVETGELQISEQITRRIEENAQRFATSAVM